MVPFSISWSQHTPCGVGSFHLLACPGGPRVRMRVRVPGHGCLLAVAALPTTHMSSGQLRLGSCVGGHSQA